MNLLIRLYMMTYGSPIFLNDAERSLCLTFSDRDPDGEYLIPTNPLPDPNDLCVLLKKSDMCQRMDIYRGVGLLYLAAGRTDDCRRIFCSALKRLLKDPKTSPLSNDLELYNLKDDWSIFIFQYLFQS